MKNRIIWKVSLLGLIIVLVLYMSESSLYLVETDVTPQYTNQDKISVNNYKEWKFHENNDRVTCNFTGLVKDPLIQGLTLKIGSFQEQKIQVKAAFYGIPVELVSPDAIPTQSDFSYQLSSDQGSLFSQGDINVEIKDKISRLEPWMIIITTAICVLAALLDIFGQKKEKG